MWFDLSSLLTVLERFSRGTPSKFAHAVNEISKLPGIGKRSALRLVLYLTKTDQKDVSVLTDAIQKLKTDLKYIPCTKCLFYVTKCNLALKCKTLYRIINFQQK